MNNNLFTEEQLEQIVLGKGEDLDVNVYTKPEFTAKEMEQIRLGLKSGVDVSVYAKLEFDSYQMEEIRLGLEKSIDVSVYAKPEYPSIVMWDIRNAIIEHGFIPDNYDPTDNSFKLSRYFDAYDKDIDLTEYMGAEYTNYKLGKILKILEIDPNFKNFDFTCEQLDEIVKGLKDDVNVNIYAKHEYSPIEMCIIRKALKNGLNIDKYLECGYEFFQLKEIFKGKENGVDISVYSDVKFNYLQMEQIRLGLEEGIDVGIYAKPEFDSYQMLEIRAGLLDSFDVSLYAKPEIDWRLMNLIRTHYEYEPNVLCLLNKGISFEKICLYQEGLKNQTDTGCFTYSLDTTAMSEMVKHLYPKELLLYANQGFNRKQLREIYLGTKCWIHGDVSIYAKKEFNAEQMKQIRLALEEGFDVKEFAKSSISAEKMENIRFNLRAKLFRTLYNDCREFSLINEIERMNRLSTDIVWQLGDKVKSGDIDGAWEMLRDWEEKSMYQTVM